MANQHNYGIRWFRSLSGQSTPQILTFPIASGYKPNPAFGTDDTTNVNLNIGDPVALHSDGTLKLTQMLGGADDSGANTDGADIIFGVIVGFPRGVLRNGIGPISYYTSGTTYSGGIGGDSAIIAAVIPVWGNIFQIDADAVLGTPTRSGALALVGNVGRLSNSTLTSGTGQPKVNPLLSVSSLSSTTSNQKQLVVTGVGAIDQDQDYTASGVTFQVMFTDQQLALNASALYGAGVS